MISSFVSIKGSQTETVLIPLFGFLSGLESESESASDDFH